MNYSYEAIDTSVAGLESLSKFLAKTFNSYKFTPDYLDWMYNKNPYGGVVGFNAIYENELAGHYALMPLEAEYKGQKIKALISINTATGSEHQGRGLFTILAKKTYAESINQGFGIVFGVANANSIPGFIRKLDFKYIDKLDTFVSLSLPKKIYHKNLKDSLSLPLSNKAFQWRLSNPNYKYSEYNNGKVKIVTSEINCFTRSIIRISEANSYNNNYAKSLLPKLNVWVGMSNAYSWKEKSVMSIKIPDFLKPSPLHLIYKNLSSQIELDRSNIHFEAINFDAF